MVSRKRENLQKAEAEKPVAQPPTLLAAKVGPTSTGNTALPCTLDRVLPSGGCDVGVVNCKVLNRSLNGSSHEILDLLHRVRRTATGVEGVATLLLHLALSPTAPVFAV